jgi:nitrate/nitrite-specific signal transduction histidine kinase
MRERAHEVGGSLRIDSAPGRGTRVIVRLPLQAMPQPAPPAGDGSAAP